VSRITWEDVLVNGAESRRVQARGRERQRAILDAAVQLFAKRGYRSTGVIALAEEVGLTHAGVLHHFGTKEALLRAVVAEREEHDEADYVRLFGAGGLSAVEALPRVGERLLADPLFQRLYTVLIAENLDPGDPLHEHFVERYRRSRRVLGRIIQHGIDQGEFRSDIDPELVATEMLAFTVGIQVQWLLDGDDVRLLETYEAFTASLISRLAGDRDA
jgi:AcrR family transcriptional regulator